MRLRTPLTLLVLLGILLGGAWYGWATITSPDEDEPTARPVRAEPTCSTSQVYKKGTRIKAKTITVNVYNAGLISGLAGDTLEALVDQGFRRGNADNAPLGVNARNVTIVTNADNSPQVSLVARQFEGPVRVIKGDPIAKGVTVIVGDAFVGVDYGAERKLVLKRKVTTCTAADGRGRQGQS